ncbi:MAG: hypothetical protein Q9M40_08370 [Sulfurimonas sp.]|nr:hypothetical protein [Sulfurimonas sp.]
MITATGFAILEFLTVIGMIGAFIMIGLVLHQQSNSSATLTE